MHPINLMNGWMNRNLKIWNKMGKIHRIIPVLIAGIYLVMQLRQIKFSIIGTWHSRDWNILEFQFILCIPFFPDLCPDLIHNLFHIYFLHCILFLSLSAQPFKICRIFLHYDIPGKMIQHKRPSLSSHFARNIHMSQKIIHCTFKFKIILKIKSTS